MVQPAPISSSSAFVPAAFEVFDPASHHGKGPANRALAELSLALVAQEAGTGPKWSPGETLRFIVLSCGAFWLAAAALYVTIH